MAGPANIEVTMAAASFTSFHPLAFQYVEALLSRPANQNHPFRGEWQAYKDCAKGLTATSTWYAVKTIMGLTNIDDYKNVLNRCPGITQYLHIRRTNQRYTSKITYSVLKPVPDIPITPATLPIATETDHPSARVRHKTMPKGKEEAILRSMQADLLNDINIRGGVVDKHDADRLEFIAEQLERIQLIDELVQGPFEGEFPAFYAHRVQIIYQRLADLGTRRKIKKDFDWDNIKFLIFVLALFFIATLVEIVKAFFKKVQAGSPPGN